MGLEGSLRHIEVEIVFSFKQKRYEASLVCRHSNLTFHMFLNQLTALKFKKKLQIVKETDKMGSISV